MCVSKAIKVSIDELKEVLKNDGASASEIKAKLDALNTSAMKLGEIMYKENQANPDTGSADANKNTTGQGAQENTSSEKKQDDVVDADFEEVQDQDDKEKKSS